MPLLVVAGRLQHRLSPLPARRVHARARAVPDRPRTLRADGGPLPQRALRSRPVGDLSGAEPERRSGRARRRGRSPDSSARDGLRSGEGADQPRALDEPAGRSSARCELFARARGLFTRERQPRSGSALVDFYEALVLYRDGQHVAARTLCRHALALFARRLDPGQGRALRAAARAPRACSAATCAPPSARAVPRSSGSRRRIRRT